MPTITCVITLTQRVREPELDQRRVVLRDVAERAAARTRRDRQLYPLGIVKAFGCLSFKPRFAKMSQPFQWTIRPRRRPLKTSQRTIRLEISR